MNIRTIFRVVLLLCFISYTSGGSFTDATSLYTYITSTTNKYIRPQADQSEATNVTVTLYLKSISGLDEVNGILTTVINLNLEWTDQIITWTPSSYGNINEIKLDESLIWTPIFLTTNPAKTMLRIGSPNVPLAVASYGTVNFDSGDLLQTTCDVDVRYFPFDTQNCDIELVPWGYKSDINMILRKSGNDAIFMNVFSENNVWIVKSTSSEKKVLGDIIYAKYTITLERRYAFFILNLFSPVLIMAILNLMVFILPPESGERVGYAITCLLALSVYLTFASESLPVSSKPISVLTIVLLLYMVISSLMCLEVILGLKIHMHDDSDAPPKYLQRLCFFQCGKKKKQVSVSPSDDEKGDFRKDEEEDDIVSWKQIGRRFDLFCLGVNSFSIIVVSVIYFGIVRSGG